MDDKKNDEIVVVAPKPMTVEGRNARLALRRQRNLRYYGSRAYMVAIAQIVLGLLLLTIFGANGPAFYQLLSGGLLMASVFPIWAGTKMMIASFTPPATISLDEHEAEDAWNASNRLLAMLSEDPADNPDPEIAATAQVVVDALDKLGVHDLRRYGMYGYPPRHSTGEGGVDYGNDSLSKHVDRLRSGLKRLMVIVAGASDIPAPQGDLDDAIGEVAAPLRFALHYHGIWIPALDDGRSVARFRSVATFDAPRIKAKDPIEEISDRLGETAEIQACRRERDRVAAIDRKDLDADLRSEVAMVLDRHLPALTKNVISAYDAAPEHERPPIAETAARSLNVMAQSLRTIADTHAITARSHLEEQTRFLASRQPQDPFEGGATS